MTSIAGIISSLFRRDMEGYLEQPVNPVTLENLDSLMVGLDPTLDDTILAICSSGDQPFALLEKAGKVVAVDREDYQIRYARDRAEALRHRNYDEFFQPKKWKPSTSYAQEIKRVKEYFNESRLDRVREKVGFLSFIHADIFKVCKKQRFSKVYLSNALDWTKEISPNEALRIVANCLPTGGLIYLVTYDSIKNIDDELPPELEKNEERTKEALETERSRPYREQWETLTVYQVYQNI